MSKINGKQNRPEDHPSQYLRDKNYNFLKIIQNRYKEEHDQQLNNHLKKIIDKFEHLQPHQKLQWSIFVFKKSEEQYKNGKLKQLKQAVKILITVCYRYKIQYNMNRLQELIKYVYFQKYGNQVLPYFQQAGYSIGEYEILLYEDSWYNKFFRLFGF